MNQSSAVAVPTPSANYDLLSSCIDHLKTGTPSADIGAFPLIVSNATAGELVALIDGHRLHDGHPVGIELYRTWLTVHGEHEQSFAIWYNLGVHLSAAALNADAIEAFRRASALRPDFFQAALNAGLVFEREGNPAAALKIWGQALQSDEARTSLLNHAGRVKRDLRILDDAETSFRRSLLTNPDQRDLLSDWIALRTTTCSWPILESDIPGLPPGKIIESTFALSALALFDDIALQHRQNTGWVAEKCPLAPQRLSPAAGYGHDKIRIGYLSSDYCSHPIAFLVTELFEMHDRERFTVYGYCATTYAGGPERDRLLAAFDHVTSIAAMKDEEAAAAIRRDEIDILVDLNGLTKGTRIPLLRWRPAPLQMTFLGYNGPIPLPELDYIVADRFVIPSELAEHHRPKPLYMPVCFQPNDAQLPVGAAEDRLAAGLPPDRFVFACFSNSYKITELMFDAWMTILARVDRSVLWLYADNEIAKKNLLQRAALHGSFEDRIIFADRVQPERYRARLALADLFLDTYPYNAGTTASDALRVGLPIVTLCGQSFVSRMAGSLLRTIGLEEGIVQSVDAYIDLAVRLGSTPALLASFRERIGGDAWRRTLGDTAGFARDLEDRYVEALHAHTAASPA